MALAEFDRRKHFRALGYANLFDYLHQGLKLSRAAAHHRRAAAWLVQRFPEVLEPIREREALLHHRGGPGIGR